MLDKLNAMQLSQAREVRGEIDDKTLLQAK